MFDLYQYVHYINTTFIFIYSMEQSPSWEANGFSGSQEIFPHFMEPVGSLPHLQVPATCPYPEPDQSSPCPQISLLEDPAKCYPPSYIRLSLPSSQFLSGFPTKNLIYTYLLSHTCCMPRPSHSSRFYCPSNIEWGVQVMEFLIVQFCSSPQWSHPP
jgi:hypothetical protein